jgi:transposase
MRHTTFRFALAPTSEQARTLARHCGASRLAFNQSLRLVTDALAAASLPLGRWLAASAGYGGAPAGSDAHSGDPRTGQRPPAGSPESTIASPASVAASFMEVSSQLAKTHSGLALEDLPVANLIRNKRLARAITDAAWSEFARQLRYKTAWLGGDLVVCERWFASTKTCSRCGRAAQQMALGTRTFRCDGCGLVMDRDCNAAANLAAWAEAAELDVAQVPDRQADGRDTHAPGGEGAGHRFGGGETGPCERGTDASGTAGAEDTREGWRPTSSMRRFGAL